MYQVQRYTCVPGPNHVRRTYLERSKGRVINTHVTTNKIKSCDRTRVVLNALRPVYNSVMYYGSTKSSDTKIQLIL